MTQPTTLERSKDHLRLTDFEGDQLELRPRAEFLRAVVNRRHIVELTTEAAGEVGKWLLEWAERRKGAK